MPRLWVPMERVPFSSMTVEAPLEASGGSVPAGAPSRRASRGGLPWAGARGRLGQAGGADTVVMGYAARVSVWARWLVWVVAVGALVYRPQLWWAADKEYLLLSVPLVAFNGLAHWRLRRGRAVSWGWLVALSGMDIVLISAAVAIGGEFHLFAYVAYYPALALFAVVFSTLWLGLAWTTMTAAVYAALSLTAGSGLDFDAGQEKALAARVAAMYAVVASVTLVARFERARRLESAGREQELAAERIELSQSIHDTAAQTAFLIGLGIQRAMRLADSSDTELAAALEAVSSLTTAAVWELRRPIDEGPIFEGRELGTVLRSHTETFATITSIPARMTQTGTEPPLSVGTRARLFSIAHNALTNASAHANAGRVEVTLDFGADCVRLSVRDDGIGLPGDYAERGRGFAGMKAAAERLGGRLIIETDRSGGGTTVTCQTPCGDQQATATSKRRS